MARTSNAKILEWGTPPEPEPTGWDAIRIELGKRPGEWANIGEFTTATARKLASERFRSADGYEVRTAPTKTDNRVAVWVRFTEIEIRTGDPEAVAALVAERLATGAPVTAADIDAAPAPKTTGRAKRGAVV
jgi:hypothetical protein